MEDSSNIIDEFQDYVMKSDPKDARRTIICDRNTNKIVSMSSTEPIKLTLDEYISLTMDEYISTTKSKQEFDNFNPLHDGTLLRVWTSDGRWNVSTRNKINAYNAYWTAYVQGKRQSFGELFEECGGNEIVQELDPEWTHEFVLEHPRNINVIPAQEPKLYLVARIRNLTGEQDFKENEMMHPSQFHENDWLFSKSLFWNGKRGLMVYKADGVRIQIDHPEFMEAEKLRQNGVTLDRAFLKTCVDDSDKIEAFRRFFPKYKARFTKIATKVNIVKDHLWYMKTVGASYEEDHELYELWKASKIEQKNGKIYWETDLDILWKVVKI